MPSKENWQKLFGEEVGEKIFNTRPENYGHIAFDLDRDKKGNLTGKVIIDVN